MKGVLPFYLMAEAEENDSQTPALNIAQGEGQHCFTVLAKVVTIAMLTDASTVLCFGPNTMVGW